MDTVVIGVSKDSTASHQKFAEKYGLPFVLLSDPSLAAIQAYGVWQEKKLYKMARGQMVRWLAERNITDAAKLPAPPGSLACISSR